MKPWVLLAQEDQLTLRTRDGEFLIQAGGRPLMSSRRHGSEDELAHVGCERVPRDGARVVVGGLGFGFTLRAALDVLPPSAAVVVSELSAAVVRWNRELPAVAALAGRPLEDARVTVVTGDVLDLAGEARGGLDAILLDVDNGPHGVSRPANARLYRTEGLATFRRALRPGGRLVVWSAGDDGRFTRTVQELGLSVRVHPAPGSAVLFVCDELTPPRR